VASHTKGLHYGHIEHGVQRILKKQKKNKRFFRALVEASHTKGAHYGHREHEAQRILKKQKYKFESITKGLYYGHRE
jgi:hypothetical protein